MGLLEGLAERGPEILGEINPIPAWELGKQLLLKPDELPDGS